MYKFPENRTNKKITFSVSDKSKSEDGTLNIAAIVNGVWTSIGSASTTGDEVCSSYTIDIPENAEAVVIYMLNETTSLYLGSVDITDSDQTLPVAIYNLSAKAATKTLTWNVGEAKGIDHFDVQGSNDGNNWTKVASIQATGEASYTVNIGESQSDSKLLYSLFLLCIPLLYMTQKNKKAMGLAFIVLCCFTTVISCSKDNGINKKSAYTEMYKYYRVVLMNGPQEVHFSEVVSLK